MNENTNSINQDIPSKGKSCFIVTPIGKENSDIRRAAEGVIDSVIIPALIENGYDETEIKVAHRISKSGSINNQIIKSIIAADMVIVNLTTLNPNVMYELAVRDAILKPAILICEEGTSLPFDVTEQRTIFYKNDMFGVQELKHILNEFLLNVPQEVDNPITRGVGRMKLLQEENVKSKEPWEYIIDKLDQLSNRTINPPVIIPKSTKLSSIGIEFKIIDDTNILTIKDLIEQIVTNTLIGMFNAIYVDVEVLLQTKAHVCFIKFNKFLESEFKAQLRIFIKKLNQELNGKVEFVMPYI